MESSPVQPSVKTTNTSLHPQSRIVNAFAVLLIFAFAVLSGVLYLENINLRKQLSQNNPVPRPVSKSCDYNGMTYQPGDGFPSSDGCNSCSCSDDGEVACTLMACANSTDDAQSPYPSVKTQSSSTPTSASITHLSHVIPPDWKTVTANDQTFSVSYDPRTHNALPVASRIDLSSINCCSSMSIRLLPYDGGSRHNFIYNTTAAIKTERTVEKEYRIDGKSALVLYNVDASGDCSAGMIGISSTQAWSFSSAACDPSGIETILSTLEFTE